jgi:hypothetical protein
MLLMIIMPTMHHRLYDGSIQFNSVSWLNSAMNNNSSHIGTHLADLEDKEEEERSSKLEEESSQFEDERASTLDSINLVNVSGQHHILIMIAKKTMWFNT